MNKDSIMSSSSEHSRGARPRKRKQASGNWNPDWEPFAELDPAWTEKVIAMAIAPRVSGALDRKMIELIGIALDVSCTHMYAPGVRRHIQRALKAGATREEIVAVLQLASMQGLHSMCLGAPILLEELEAIGGVQGRGSADSSQARVTPKRKRS
jgi:alkylhydroperoxidase/carboxymuconolactone decarboxylase family protein YurZ